MKFYTGVGSRDIPDDIETLLIAIGIYLAKKNYTLRSGGADGSDNSFLRGAVVVPWTTPYDLWEIYLPWKGFNNHPISENFIDATKLDNYQEAIQIASTIHPVWDKLTRGPKALHTRNVYQVLGKDLKTPSDLFVCYAEPTGSGVKGGTNTAFQLAKKYGVPIFNVYRDEDRKQIESKVYAIV